MSEKCEHLEKCGFFINFQGNTDTIVNGWIAMYCDSKEKSESCERKKIKNQTGKPPADNMAPTGRMLLIIKNIKK